jgi:hypothetical protein
MNRIEPTISKVDVDALAKKPNVLRRLPFSARAIAYFALLYGSSTFLYLGFDFISNQPLQLFTLMWLLTCGFAAIIAGAFALYGRRWAFWLLAVLFFPQTIEYFSFSNSFALIGPLPALRVGWGWYSPPVQININLLAVVICMLAVSMATRAKLKSL